MTAASTLLVVPGGDHSLVVSAKQLKTTGETQDDVDARVLGAVARFVTGNS